ncbi:MAG: hypothetical protein M1813_005122 [Trichoglossum hirsutum]|nr:MAG: hypothetical protein M1813_005122 [Trichoglossum hirsutum]
MVFHDLAGSQPDIMNDPAYATNDSGGSNEQDTCRICRGEGSATEPLFYPCKCSGSIKFVHQECLMEWLLHSQKKHCELCKTPFRFTKLYHPQMPPSVPFPVFIRHLLSHGVRTLLTWLRFLLVCFVWVGWLPWSMRAVWRFLFWLGDGGWHIWEGANSGRSQAADIMATSAELLTGMLSSEWRTSPTSTNPLALSSPTPLTASRTASILPSVPASTSQTLKLSSGPPIAFSVLKYILFDFGSRASTTPTTPANSTEPPNMKLQYRHPTFLSNVTFLNSLTRSPTFNKLVIDTFEGQIITISVVIAFILVFLIREWVVQQQPGINMGDGLDAEFWGPARPADVQEGDAREGVALGNLRAAILDREQRHEQQQQVEQLERDIELFRGVNGGAGPVRPIARARRRVHFPPPIEETRADIGARGLVGNADGEAQENGNVFGRRLEDGEVFRFNGSPNRVDPGVQQRPGLPNRDALSRGAEIRRTIEEEPLGEFERRVLQEAKDIRRRGSSKPSEVLRIIKEENSAAESARVAEAMKRSERSGPSSVLRRGGDIDGTGEEARPTSLEPWHDDFETMRKGKSKARDVQATRVVQHDVGSNESWLGVLRATSSNFEDPEYSKDHKGKGKLIQDQDKSLESDSESSGSSETHWLRETRKENRRVDYEGDIIEFPDFGDSGLHASSTPNGDGSKPKGNVDSIRAHGGSSIPIEFSASTNPEVAARNLVEGDETRGDRSENSSQFDQFPENTPFYHEHIESAEAALAPAREPSDGFRGETHLENEHMMQPQRAIARQPPQGLLEQLADWLWGDIVPDGPPPEDAHENFEHVVQDLADEPPFVPVAHNEPGGQPAHLEEDAGHAPNVADGGLDPMDAEAIEDGEDFEGVMELIGMRGPLTGLFQNGMFSAVLISTTVGAGVWFPYIWGKFVLLFLCHPITLLVKAPLRGASFAADLVVDSVLFSTGSFVYWIDSFLRLCFTLIGLVTPMATRYSRSTMVSNAARGVIEGAIERISKIVLSASVQFSGADYPTFSVLSHEALHITEARIARAFGFVFRAADASYREVLNIWRYDSFENATRIPSFDLVDPIVRAIGSSFEIIRKGLALAPKGSWNQRLFNISLDIPRRTAPDPNLAYWGPWDRAIAIVAGYAFFSIVGALYLKRGSPFSTSRQGRKIESVITKILQQAGGVLKVILIIGIEMIVFPLYCGMLLDLALLPLFEKATFMSRVIFTLTAPFTSIFVHWFVGTCYMFHFALFVSMCRKIMRSGVLYFIRDPDDATFHPVRDVLERSVSTQLRKIAFSALVYGALVIVCLGGVVWGLYYTFDGILPIHWSSNEPVLEFPVDLLFYNFLMPVVIRFFKPSDGLHMMYSWWFRVCGRMLRLSWFLFGERQEDEEGHHVRRTWWDLLLGKKGDVHQPVIGEDRRVLAEDRNVDAYFLRDGKYVRAPASDQVRIPKGGKVFLEVNEDNERVDGQPDREDGLHGRNTELFAKVYVPPWFRVRISLFILFIWIFAAVTGVSITVVPLVFGRMIFSTIIPNHLRMNDVYAFSIGIYILGGLIYGALWFQNAIASVKKTVTSDHQSLNQALRRATKFSTRVARLLYTYAAFAFLLPSLFALLMEFYVIIPIHTYFTADEEHVIHFIQDWTLGVLYVKMAGRLILWYSQSRPAEALRAIVRKGWFDPNARIATRCFIMPATVIMGGALLVPIPLGYVVNTLCFSRASAATHSQVYRYSYPAVLVIIMVICLVYLMGVMLKGWRQKIRDEVYLIGERLHNFGERRPPAPSPVVVT